MPIDCRLYAPAILLPVGPLLIHNWQLYGISLGLDHLHAHKIIHGDLKAVRCLEVSGYIFSANGKPCFVSAQRADR